MRRVLTRRMPCGLRPFLSHRVAGRLGRRLTLSRAACEATAFPGQNSPEHLGRSSHKRLAGGRSLTDIPQIAQNSWRVGQHFTAWEISVHRQPPDTPMLVV